MDILENEIFGPVLSIVREPTLDAALATLNRSKYGNMGVIFTSSGYNARRFKTHAQVGMVGINVGVPAPMAVFPFAGWKQSFFGDLHANGEDAAKFLHRIQGRRGAMDVRHNVVISQLSLGAKMSPTR